jgi:hypothetical protein
MTTGITLFNMSIGISILVLGSIALLCAFLYCALMGSVNQLKKAANFFAISAIILACIGMLINFAHAGQQYYENTKFLKTNHIHNCVEYDVQKKLFNFGEDSQVVVPGMKSFRCQNTINGNDVIVVSTAINL